MASLDGVRAKIEWAYEHLKSLESHVRRDFNEIPSRATVKVEPDTNRILSVSVEGTVASSKASLIIGDCLQNFRSSLDYLVWELVTAANNIPDIKHPFPICET